MDPNATLEHIREMVVKVLDLMSETDENHTVYDLATAIASMDGWLTTGGYLPDAWYQES